MEEKINKLNDCIGSNPNLTDEAKENISYYFGKIVEKLSDYNYDNYGSILSTLSIVPDDTISGYSAIDIDTSTIRVNLSRMQEDMVDWENVVLIDLLSMGSKITSNEGLRRGIATNMVTNVIGDEGEKSLYPLENILTSLLGDAVGADVLLDANFNSGLEGISNYLSRVGVSEDEPKKLFQLYDELGTSPTSFADAEGIIVDMFSRIAESGIYTNEELDRRFYYLSGNIITGRKDLEVFPHYDFSSLTGFEKVSAKLGEIMGNPVSFTEIDEELPFFEDDSPVTK